MKRLNITRLFARMALMAALAMTIAGCAGTSNTEANQTSGSAAAESSASSATKEAEAASSSAAEDEATSSTTPDAHQDVNAGGGMQGGMGGALDLQPGQTNDKGYTATDNGIAITTTLNADDAFTSRDLEQSADTTNATKLTLANGKDISITEEGVYVISGSANEATIVVDATNTAKVQLVLDGVSISNADFPAIYVKSADKVFVTLVGENTLEVTGEFVADGDTNTDAVIFSKDDLCLNGTGSLTINSTEHAIVSKDDLKVTGGTYTLNAAVGSGLRANDSVRIASGTFTIAAEDGIKAKNDDDNELGYIYIQDGTFNIDATDNGLQGYAFVWIDGGTFEVSAEECIEGTFIQINDGALVLDSTDDGINASVKSSVYTPTIEINGGTLTINMAAGDTDALDSNGYLFINDGVVNLNAQSPFDYAWGAGLNGGEVYVNGTQVSEITESMMGGGFGGPGGNMSGDSMDFAGPQGGPQGDRMPEDWDGEAPPTPPEWDGGERPERPQRS